jgi:hypothetical protein
MLVLLAFAFPGLLLLLLLAMEAVEAPLRDVTVSEQLAEFFDEARPDEVETFVSEGLDRALNRYWHRRGVWRRLRTRRLPARG